MKKYLQFILIVYYLVRWDQLTVDTSYISNSYIPVCKFHEGQEEEKFSTLKEAEDYMREKQDEESKKRIAIRKNFKIIRVEEKDVQP